MNEYAAVTVHVMSKNCLLMKIKLSFFGLIEYIEHFLVTMDAWEYCVVCFN
jgi:hypothetical protein